MDGSEVRSQKSEVVIARNEVTKQSSVALDEKSGLLRCARNDRFSDLRQRILTGVAFAALAGGMLYLGGWFWGGFVALCGVQMLREWQGLTKHRSLWFRFLGIPYILIPCSALIFLETVHYDITLWLLVTIVAANDIGAYFAGRLIGGPKLAPRLSPNKTWAGLGGGVIAAILAGMAFDSIIDLFGRPFFSPLGGILALVAQAGDMFESSLKRHAGVKDAGNILPGHGGLLDRVDGLLFAATVFTTLLFIFPPMTD